MPLCGRAPDLMRMGMAAVNAAVFELLILKFMDKKEFWKMVINVVVAALSAIATALGVSSCMGNPVFH